MQLRMTVHGPSLVCLKRLLAYPRVPKPWYSFMVKTLKILDDPLAELLLIPLQVEKQAKKKGLCIETSYMLPSDIE